VEPLSCISLRTVRLPRRRRGLPVVIMFFGLTRSLLTIAHSLEHSWEIRGQHTYPPEIAAIGMPFTSPGVTNAHHKSSVSQSNPHDYVQKDTNIVQYPLTALAHPRNPGTRRAIPLLEQRIGVNSPSLGFTAFRVAVDCHG
jgi:hypothetical protein